MFTDEFIIFRTDQVNFEFNISQFFLNQGYEPTKKTEFYAWIFGVTMLTLGSMTTITSCFVFCLCSDKALQKRVKRGRHGNDNVGEYHRIESVSYLVDHVGCRYDERVSSIVDHVGCHRDEGVSSIVDHVECHRDEGVSSIGDHVGCHRDESVSSIGDHAEINYDEGESSGVNNVEEQCDLYTDIEHKQPNDLDTVL